MSAPAKSAMVRASFKMRSLREARADSCPRSRGTEPRAPGSRDNWAMAVLMRFCDPRPKGVGECGVELAVNPHIGRAHVGVGDEVGRIVKASQLPVTGSLHPRAAKRNGAGFAQPVIGQLVILDTRDLDALRVSMRSSRGPEMRFW